MGDWAASVTRRGGFGSQLASLSGQRRAWRGLVFLGDRDEGASPESLLALAPRGPHSTRTRALEEETPRIKTAVMRGYRQCFLAGLGFGVRFGVNGSGHQVQSLVWKPCLACSFLACLPGEALTEEAQGCPCVIPCGGIISATELSQRTGPHKMNRR